MANNKLLILIQIGTNKRTIGIATNALAAYMILQAARTIAGDESSLEISEGEGRGRTANYHNFLQAIKIERTAQLSSSEYQYHFNYVPLNRLLAAAEKTIEEPKRVRIRKSSIIKKPSPARNPLKKKIKYKVQN